MRDDATLPVPYGSLVAFANECLYPERGSHTEIGAIYRTYRAWCRLHAIEPLAQVSFAEQFANLCGRLKIVIMPTGGWPVFVLHTRCSPLPDRAPATKGEVPAELWATPEALPARPAWATRARQWFRRASAE